MTEWTSNCCDAALVINTKADLDEMPHYDNVFPCPKCHKMASFSPEVVSAPMELTFKDRFGKTVCYVYDNNVYDGSTESPDGQGNTFTEAWNDYLEELDHAGLLDD